MTTTQPVCIGYYANSQEAHLAASILRDHGLECTIIGDQISDSLSWYGMAIRKVELMTRAEDAAEARQLLEDHGVASGQTSKEPWGTNDDLDWVCAECDEQNASTFDKCWSCGQPMPHNPEHRAAEAEAVLVDTGRFSEVEAPEESSPYRAPMTHESRVVLLPNHDLVRRVVRATLLSLWFPPLGLYTLYLLSQVFQAGKPPRRVYVAMAATWLILIGGTGYFAIVILG